MDEKIMVSTNALNAAFKKQMEKREAAPPVSMVAAASHIVSAAAPAASVAAPAAGFDFCTAWRTYYPRIVSLLGWASWVIPGPALTVIKSLLAVINSEVVPMICRPKP